MEKKLYFQISRYYVKNDVRQLMGTYIQPVDEIVTAIEGEIDGWDTDSSEVLEIQPIEVTQYDNLPKFQGY